VDSGTTALADYDIDAAPWNLRMRATQAQHSWID
jgi:hypothetical protein